MPRTVLIHDPPSRLATINMGQKMGGYVCPFSGGSRVPIKHKVIWAEAYLHIKWHLSPSSRLAKTENGHGPKIGGCAPLGEGIWVSI